VGPPPAEPPWPTEEVWSWRAAPELRVVEIEGGSPVDPAQVGVPWSEPLPTSVLDRSQSLQIAERSRGKDAEQPHRLSLQRELWLAFDGASMTARDQLSGRLAQVGRLNVSPPWTLQRASEAGGDLLVTSEADGRMGVELRNPTLALHSTGRHAGRGKMPASGWQVDLESMSAVLHLPPGWRLLAAGGVDRAPQTWISQWSLLDLFLLAVAGLLAFRLHGAGFAAVLLAYLGLGYHEADAPLWSLLGVIALSLLLSVLGPGRLARGLRIVRDATLAAALLLSLPFIAEQLKLALHPQLERSEVESNRDYGASADAYRRSRALGDGDEVAEAVFEQAAAPAVVLDEPTPMSVPAPSPAPPPPPQPRANSGKMQAQVQMQLNSYPDDAVLQAGPGTPDWRWQRLELGWSGPVLASQEIDLWLSPPWLTRVLRVLAVALLVVVLMRLAKAVSLARNVQSARATGTGLLLVLALGVPGGAPKAADFPPAELLDALRERLLQAPACVPHCASLDSVEIEVAGDQLSLVLLLHAEDTVAVPLPEPGKAAAPLRAELDGREAQLVSAFGQRWLRLTRGVQRAQLSWTMGAGDQLDLRFPMPPAALRVRADGWETGGLDGSRLLGDTLQLLRLRTPDAAGVAPDAAAPAQDFPPFVRVTRRLLLDLDWTISTEVERVAPAQSGFSVSVPLVPGEAVLDDRLEVAEGAVKLSFAAGENHQAWRSRLPVSEELLLSMGSLRNAGERWEVQVGAWWHATFSGLPETSVDALDGIRRFDPRPDEQLRIRPGHLDHPPG
jgi:hypothetical protein